MFNLDKDQTRNNEAMNRAEQAIWSGDVVELAGWTIAAGNGDNVIATLGDQRIKSGSISEFAAWWRSADRATYTNANGETVATF